MGSPLSVELAIGAWILLMLAADLFVPAARRPQLWGIALAGVAVAGACWWRRTQPLSPVLLQGLTSVPIQPGTPGMWVLDPFAELFKGFFLLTAAVVIVMTRGFARQFPTHLGAFYALFFTALLGMMTLASMHDFLLLFLGLELLTFSLYVMAAYVKTDARAIEAGLKYLILGSVSSGFLVYGIALLYGVAGSTDFAAVRSALAAGSSSRTAQAGGLLVLAGLGFKVAAVPFHLWVPDVYEGAPTPVVAFLSVGSKMAGVVALLRILDGVFAPLQGVWSGLLAIIAAATVLYGNLAALPQTNMKRLLGYSSIGQAGYLLMGLSTASSDGRAAVGYYLLAYLVSNLAVFLVVVAVSDATGGETLDDYKGLSKRSGGLAAAMFLGLLSLAGVPPLAGFAGKLFVLMATVGSGRLWLAAIGAVNVAVSLYYYLMIVKRLYVDLPPTTSAIAVSAVTQTTLVLLALGILAVGICQGPFLQQISAAVQP